MNDNNIENNIMKLLSRKYSRFFGLFLTGEKFTWKI